VCERKRVEGREGAALSFALGFVTYFSCTLRTLLFLSS